MQHWTRRQLLLAGLALPLLPRRVQAATGRVIVLGGGFAGATAARAIKQQAPQVQVILVEAKTQYATCPFSNLALVGGYPLAGLHQGYQRLHALGVEQVSETAELIDSERQELRLSSGLRLRYDRLLLAPGIDMRWDAIDGYSPALAEQLPHAWQAGAQTRLLQRQLQAMADGQTLIISVPANPYRCPPGPYERASLIAQYLKQHKPRSKLLILDAKDSFSKQSLFQQHWQQHHAQRIEWIGRAADGQVVALDAKRRELHTEFGQRHRAAVINLIPPQQAAAVARRSNLTDASGWVPIDPQTFACLQAPHIYAIGDACIAAPMPKSAFSAHAQAQVAVQALLNEWLGLELPAVGLQNTCYSLLQTGQAVSIGAHYQVQQGLLQEVPGSAHLSPLAGDLALRAHEANVGQGWYQQICRAIWG